MIIDFESRRTTLVATPVDGRCGLSSLKQIAESILGIKVTEGADCVVFISKARKICKIIFWGELGGCVITRRLNSGRFARYSDASHGAGGVFASLLPGFPLNLASLFFCNGHSQCRTTPSPHPG